MFVSTVQRRWKTFEAYLTARMYPIALFLLSTTTTATTTTTLGGSRTCRESHAYTRKHVYTHTRARAEIGHAQLSLATFLTPTIGEGASGEGLRERAALDFRPFPFSRARLNGFFLAANMADDAMRLATAAVASVLDGLSDADARRRDANLAAAPPPRRRRRSPAVFRFVLANDPAFVRTTR